VAAENLVCSLSNTPIYDQFEEGGRPVGMRDRDYSGTTRGRQTAAHAGVGDALPALPAPDTLAITFYEARNARPNKAM
jgi:hypothetical protein